MSLAERLKSDAAAALKAGQKERVSTLRMLASELHLAGKEQPTAPTDEIALLQRERKRRLEAATAYRDAGRDDLADCEQREASIIEAYLPQQLSDLELHAIVGDAVAELGASSPAEIGRVMAIVMPRVKGKAEGKRVSAVVQQALTA